ncbi:hypothetical protein [Paenibacillus hexagrammi]|uniref:Uncharacterized protein n=1 Tax=Paenibacillus hexagrammi TaxID=2908839 RepID=A0ABY3SKY7_9BACL|nr:hypothetical protein [Paenibacillus sp. YPD9-1]UJF34518.1 hypothetical protein L0M14_04865 [Paenibacillus sp. YPD9-1]
MMRLYFRDNFFYAGQTDILNESNERIGEVDLRSAFGSSLGVFDQTGQQRYTGKFPVFSNKWVVSDGFEEERGVLRYRFSFFTKRYEYYSQNKGVFEITSPAFSREYEVRSEDGRLAATFEKVNGWFSASAYCLENFTDELDSFEWVAVILGMHEIQKRHNSAN